jgi:Type II CAAX prenyl endopeptidase Rce1-like
VRTLTLTPDVRAYAIAATVVYSLSCAWLAGIVVARSRRARDVGFLGVYVAILLLVAAPAVLVLRPAHVTGPALGRIALAVPLGAVAGCVCVWAEVLVTRAVRRRERARRETRRSADQPLRYAAAAPPGALQDRAFEMVQGQPRRGRILALLLAVATLEEILFRGVLLDLALSLPGDVAAGAAICGIAIAFALTHVSFGWTAVVGKLPLAAIATAAALVTGTVVAAVAAHAVVNVRAWRS